MVNKLLLRYGWSQATTTLLTVTVRGSLAWKSYYHHPLPITTLCCRRQLILTQPRIIGIKLIADDSKAHNLCPMLSFSAHAGSSVSFMWKVRFMLRVVKGRLARQEFMSSLCHRPATTICVSFTVDLCVSLTLTLFYLQFAVIDRVPGFCSHPISHFLSGNRVLYTQNCTFMGVLQLTKMLFLQSKRNHKTF